MNKQARVSRRMLLVEREVPTILGILLVVALVILGALVGCDAVAALKKDRVVTVRRRAS